MLQNKPYSSWLQRGWCTTAIQRAQQLHRIAGESEKRSIEMPQQKR